LSYTSFPRNTISASTDMSAVIPQGSLVLVTGANGFIGSHVVDQLLQAGYKVRGTVRTESKGTWVKEHFDAKYGAGKLELAVVPDMSAKSAYDDAVKGESRLVITETRA